MAELTIMARHRYCWVFLELLTLCLVVSVAQDSTGTTDPYILLANGKFIQQFSLDGSHRRAIINNSRFNTIALDYDYRRNFVFWSDRTLKTIMRANLDGSNQRVLANTSLRFPDGLAWDWINHKLYWTDWSPDESMIAVLDPALDQRKVLFSARFTDVSRIRSIVVDPSNRWLYWSDWSGDSNEMIGKIERSSMDGQNRETIHEGLGWPTAMTIDYENQMLYWTDALTNTIERSRVDGSGREILLENNTFVSFLMSFFQGQLYLSNVAGGLGLYTLGTEAIVSHTNFQFTSGTFGIQVVSPDRQMQAPNPCAPNNGGCSHLCLLSAVARQGFSCACPNDSGLVLARNRRTCVDPNDIVPIPTTTGSVVSTAVTSTPKPTTVPGICLGIVCQNGGTCQNLDLDPEYDCACLDGYGGRNCEFITATGIIPAACGDEFMVPAPIFVGVVAGLVVVIFLMFIATLCVFGSMKRRKPSLEGSNAIINRQTESNSVSDHDYMSIKSNRSSPGPKTHYYITLPGASNESSPRESSIQDSAVKEDPTISENPAYETGSWRSKGQTL